MKLTFSNPFRSIKEFPDTELPPFTLITGLNGSGKTHFLKAIAEGWIRVDSVSEPRNEVLLYDWKNLEPPDSGSFHGATLIQERAQLFSAFAQVRHGAIQQLTQVLRDLNLPASYTSDPGELCRLTQSDLCGILGCEKAEAAAGRIKAAMDQVSASMMRQPRLMSSLGRVSTISARANKPIVALSREDFESSELFSWAETDPFQHSLARLFVAYRDLRQSNQLRQLAECKGQDAGALSDHDFCRKYGPAPWEFANQIFHTAGLDFEIAAPDEFSQSAYTAQLRKLSTGAEVLFQDLSSGERILAALALCVYSVEGHKWHLARFPKLVLFDEIDAPLHPSMARNFIRTVTEVLVKSRGIHVIATTHSAATVALTPNEAIHVMESGRPGVHKTTKSEALNILTLGVPTLAISYEGRRQVLVESPRDADVYETLYLLVKPWLGSERSLEFMATGAKTTGPSHINTGCEIVTKIVGDLAAAGNSSVFGLVDWDGRHRSKGRVKVLAENLRNGLENVILDPLLIASLIVRDVRTEIGKLGLAPDQSYVNFLAFPDEKLQAVVEAIQLAVLGCQSLTDLVEVKYAGKLQLMLSRAYLECDDHHLECLVVKAFPALRKISKDRTGLLTREVAETVMRDKPEFIPMEIIDCFDLLLRDPTHLN